MKLDRSFYNRDTLLVAKELLGKILVHEAEGIRISGKIVEVEAYIGPMDKAAHSYNYRKTERVLAMYGESGTAYVYIIYGMHYCFNVVTNGIGKPEAVLIRGIEPIDGQDIMSYRRYDQPFQSLNKRQIYNLTSGPSKICSAFNITKNNNKQELLGEELYIEYGIEENFPIKASRRIGINYAEEAKEYLWRFYVEGNKFVSRK